MNESFLYYGVGIFFIILLMYRIMKYSTFFDDRITLINLNSTHKLVIDNYIIMFIISGLFLILYLQVFDFILVSFFAIVVLTFFKIQKQ